MGDVSFPRPSPVPIDGLQHVRALGQDGCAVTRSGDVACLASVQSVRSLGLAGAVDATRCALVGDGEAATHPGAPPTHVVEPTLDSLPEPASKQCFATRESRAACFSAGLGCAVVAAPVAGPCAGGAFRRMPPPAPEPTPKGPCLCTCSREYREAERAFLAHLNRCARIPRAAPGPTHP